MRSDRENALSVGLVLIGVGLLFLLPGVSFWPWILVVVAIGGLPTVIAQGRSWWAWQSTFWLIGLAILFATGYFWPGILVLGGLSMLLGGLTHTRQPAEPGTEATEDTRDTAAVWPDISDVGDDSQGPPLREDPGAYEPDASQVDSAAVRGKDTDRL